MILTTQSRTPRFLKEEDFQTDLKMRDRVSFLSLDREHQAVRKLTCLHNSRPSEQSKAVPEDRVEGCSHGTLAPSPVQQSIDDKDVDDLMLWWQCFTLLL